MLCRREQFGKDGAGHVVLTLRCVLESEGNGGALIEPVVNAVSSCLTPEWEGRGLELIEAFDRLPLLSLVETMRGLDLFKPASLGSYLGIVLKNKLCKILEPREVKPATKVTPVQVPFKIARIPGIERNIALGLKLLELKARSRRSNDFSELRRKHFPDVDQKLATAATSVARMYDGRPEIYRRLSWQALVRLSAPSLPAQLRQEFEARILAGGRVTCAELERARGERPNRGPRQTRPERLAA
jgi:hypothetical protein